MEKLTKGTRFPNGLQPVVQAGKNTNMAFGIWFGPGRINPKSELFKNHPEWAMRVPGGECLNNLCFFMQGNY